MTRMNWMDQSLFNLARPLLNRNTQFNNCHAGQECYIFGNGASLKGMDLAVFSDRIAIGCNSLFVHKDFEELDCRYYFLPASFLFHRYRKYYGRWYRNYMGDLYREKILANPGVKFFTSLSNWVGLRADNLYYTHHFGGIGWNFELARLDGQFSFMQGGLYAMVGLAFSMGFSSVTLVGCDYAFLPRHGSHFFEKGVGNKIESEDSTYGGSFFSECAKVITLTIITPDGMSSGLMPSLEYSCLAGKPTKYKENTEIVSAKDLDILANQGYYNIF